MIDHSVVSVLGAPGIGGGCSSNCSVGGSPFGTGATNSDGKAQGGHVVTHSPEIAISGSESGTLAVPGGQTTGHVNQVNAGLLGGPSPGILSGNLTNPSSKGHCTGFVGSPPAPAGYSCS